MEITQSEVAEALRLEDVEGLLELGSPEDEYLHEAQQIASALAQFSESALTVEKLIDVVREVWVRSFGPFSDEDIQKRVPAFSQVAHRILSDHP